MPRQSDLRLSRSFKPLPPLNIVGSYVTTFILPYLPAFFIIVIFRKLPGRPLHTALETTLLEQGAHTLAQTREILLKNTNGTIPRYEAERMAGKLCLHYIGIRTLLIWFILLDCLKSSKWPI